MVCSKCQRKLQKTELATPAVKRKDDLYYGSPTTSAGGGGGGGGDGKKRSSALLGNAGISKVCCPSIILRSFGSSLYHFLLYFRGEAVTFHPVIVKFSATMPDFQLHNRAT